MNERKPEAESDGEVLIVRRTIRTNPERAFAAWTDPAEIQRWWGPGPVTCPAAEVDLRAGGAYRIANRKPDGTVMWIVGEFELVEPPRRLVYSWRVDPEAAPERVEVTFSPHAEGTEVVVRHGRIRDRATRDGHAEGWEGCLAGLADYLSEARTR
jgi:uncharacterized protein YndB with AHSA1/START domain